MPTDPLATMSEFRGWTPKMRAVQRELQFRYGRGLRRFIHDWRALNPRHAVEDLAETLGVGRRTLYRWLEILQIELGGPIFIDHSGGYELQAVVDDGTGG